MPFLKRILRQPVTQKTIITQDIREQRNVGIPLELGCSSNRTMTLAIRKKMTNFSNWKRILKTKMMSYPLSE